jgi:hypothetical protein
MHLFVRSNHLIFYNNKQDPGPGNSFFVLIFVSTGGEKDRAKEF